ncbi:MAG: lysophospholipid acyltransferase family protein [Bryobacteraceae bacterium]|nr:lysophospholipid acyltransferase family protein [Bryobacteraceae bacterium]
MPHATPPAGADRVFSSVLAQHRLPAPVSGALGRVLLLDQLDALYRQVVSGPPDKLPFERLLDILNIRVKIAPGDLDHIPLTGPAVFVANHPFGFIEGCILAAILPRIRPDVKIMANSLISAFAALSSHFLFVNPFGGAEATKENRRGLRSAIEHLRSGGLLVVFPAGEVAHLDLRERSVIDPPWNPGVAGFARITGATILPAFFDGANSALFQLLGLVHPRMRTVMLPQEFLNKQKQTIELRIGSPLAPASLDRFDTDEQRIAWIRQRAYILRHRGQHKPTLRIAIPNPFHRNESVAAPVRASQLESEILALPASRRLVSIGELYVYSAAFHEAPAVLREIGRLREITFRRVGEGTGKALDIDSFDAHYSHLFIWNAEAREIAGAYRLGPVDEICRTHGIRGLYTSTLFQYGEAFLQKLGGNSLELGRSFVRPEYQKSYTPLLLLWKGIATWVAQHPQYTVLFGPVSISNDYTSVSRQLMVSYFTSKERGTELASMVRARHPLWRNPLWNNLSGNTLTSRPDNVQVWDIEELSAVIADIETDGKGLPVLLRQYLKLGGKLVGFNVDKAFSNVLDGLIVVDLRATERRVLERYMGKTEAAEFFRCNALHETAAQKYSNSTGQPVNPGGG